MSAKYLLLFAFTLGVLSNTRSEPNIPNTLGVSSLPPNMEEKIDPEELTAAYNRAGMHFKARCDQNGGPDAFLKFMNATGDMTQCVTGLVNFSELPLEIEQAKPNGGVGELFKKYCAKKPQLDSCVNQFTNVTSACLSEEERGYIKAAYNVSLQLVHFICFKEGDRIALFIVEGGQECFQTKQEDLKGCFNSTGYMPMRGIDFATVANVPSRFDEKQCKQMLELQKCVVGVLETCPKPTSANIVESLFMFIRKVTPCNAYDETLKGGATTFYVTSATIVTALVAAVLV